MTKEHQIPQVEIQELNFPCSASKKFVKYIDSLSGVKSPYCDYREMRFVVAYKMLEALVDSLTCFEVDSGDSYGVDFLGEKNEERSNEERGSEERGSNARDAEEILQIIKDIRNDKDPSAFVIHDFPVDLQESFLDTPSDSSGFDSKNPQDMGKVGFVSEWAMVAFNTAIGGELYFSPKEQGGLNTHHIVAREGKSFLHTNAGCEHFPVHTEGSHLPAKVVDILTLLTLKNVNTPTIIIPMSVIEKALRKELGEKFEMLFEPRFKFIPGDIQENGKTSDYIVEPMIYRNEEGEITRWRLNASPSRMVAEDLSNKEVSRLVLQVAEILESLKCGYVSTYGDLFFINNTKGAAHSRTAFASEDRGNPKINRHLLRQQTTKSHSVKDDFMKFVQKQKGGNSLEKWLE